MLKKIIKMLMGHSSHKRYSSSDYKYKKSYKKYSSSDFGKKQKALWQPRPQALQEEVQEQLFQQLTLESEKNDD
jgi:hypothetical protein